MDCFEGLDDAGDRLNAGAVVNLVSDVNDKVFKQIISGGDSMTEELKEMLVPELGELRIIIANQNAELADRDAKLADRDAKLADSFAKLADRDAEIALLKRMLSENKRIE